MNKFVLILLVCVLASCKCDKDDVLGTIKNDIKTSNYPQGEMIFVSMFFSKNQDKTIVQVVPFINRLFNYNIKCYYKRDSMYLFMCSGFCEDFSKQNEFSEWNDSLDNYYQNFLYYIDYYRNHSDSLYHSYIKRMGDIKELYYEYDGIKLNRIDSVTIGEKLIIDCQADSFNIGYSIESQSPLPPPPPAE